MKRLRSILAARRRRRELRRMVARFDARGYAPVPERLVDVINGGPR